jgi:hypothetical protein
MLTPSRSTGATALCACCVSRGTIWHRSAANLKSDSVLGTYAITEEGKTTLEAPLGPYRVTAESEIEPAPVDQVGG